MKFTGPRSRYFVLWLPFHEITKLAAQIFRHMDGASPEGWGGAEPYNEINEPDVSLFRFMAVAV